MNRDFYTFNLDYDFIYKLHVDYFEKNDILKFELQRFASFFGPLERKKGAIWGGGFGGHITYSFLKDRCDQIVMIDQDPESVANDFTRIQVVSPQAFLSMGKIVDFILITTHPKHYAIIAETISKTFNKAICICMLYNNPTFYATRSVEKKRVILSTLPKSGTSWLNSMLKDILLDHKNYRYKEDRCIADMQYEMYFTNHLTVSEVLPFVENRENRFIFLYRDIRDHLVSWVHHYKHRKNNIDYKLSRYMATLDFEEALLEFIIGEPNTKGYGTSAISPVKRTCLMVNEWLQLAADKQNVHTVTYENLQKNGLKELQHILTFIGIQMDDGVLSQILEKRSFKKMAQGRDPGEEDKSNHLRKGVVGDWENYFTPLVKDVFKKMAGDFIVKTGYEPDNGW